MLNNLIKSLHNIYIYGNSILNTIHTTHTSLVNRKIKRKQYHGRIKQATVIHYTLEQIGFGVRISLTLQQFPAFLWIKKSITNPVCLKEMPRGH